MSLAKAKTGSRPKTGRRAPGSKVAASLTEVAYVRLKEDIITGFFAPGCFINERQFCDHLQMGRTPIHQALGQLHQERLIDIIPRKGIIIRQVSIEEYIELEELRLIIGTAAARLAAERRTEAQLAELEALAERTLADRAGRDVRNLMLHSRDFFFAFAQATGNASLAAIVRSTYEKALRFRFASIAAEDVDEESTYLADLVEALRAHDGDKAAALVAGRIRLTRLHKMRDLAS